MNQLSKSYTKCLIKSNSKFLQTRFILYSYKIVYLKLIICKEQNFISYNVRGLKRGKSKNEGLSSERNFLQCHPIGKAEGQRGQGRPGREQDRPKSKL